MEYSYGFYRDVPALPLSNSSDPNCTEGVQWIHTVLRQCVYDSRRYASVIVGLGSTLVSVINCVPQVYTNCASGIPHKALSIFLLIQWLLGDSLNLLGCILSKQLPVQVVYAIFMVGMDITLITQYVFFKVREQIREKTDKEQDSVDKEIQTATTINQNGQIREVFCITMLWGISFIGLNIFGYPISQDFVLVQKVPGGRSLLSSTPFFADRTDAVGFGIGVASTCFYIGSRLPQIYRNNKRKSTEGINIFLFVLMILSNALYTTAILLQSTSYHHVFHSLPWIIGSSGMITFDFIILSQFLAYRKNKANGNHKRVDINGSNSSFNSSSERTPLLA